MYYLSKICLYTVTSKSNYNNSDWKYSRNTCLQHFQKNKHNISPWFPISYQVFSRSGHFCGPFEIIDKMVKYVNYTGFYEKWHPRVQVASILLVEFLWVNIVAFCELTSVLCFVIISKKIATISMGFSNASAIGGDNRGNIVFWQNFDSVYETKSV